MKYVRKILLLAVCMLCGIYLFAQQAVTLHFNNIAGNKALLLNSEKYANAAGEQFSISLLQYFISNIQFSTADGKQYIVPQDSSYFFIQQDDSTSQYCTVYVPAGDYTSINFIVGIDSLRSTSKIDKRKGVLDPSATDMYWGWNSGYIFFKMEGTSSSAPEDAAGLHKFRYHIGGFGGYQSKTINNIKTINLHFSKPVMFTGNKTTIEINADILELFNGAAQISIAQHSAVMFDAFSTIIADNYARMFSLAGIKN